MSAVRSTRSQSHIRCFGVVIRLPLRYLPFTPLLVLICSSLPIQMNAQYRAHEGTAHIRSLALEAKSYRPFMAPLNAAPDDFRTAREKAEEAMNATDYRKASIFLEQWLAAVPNDTTSRVLQAMCYAKIALPEKAFAQLEAAAQCGLSDLKRLNTEPEFGPLRQLPRWSTLVQSVSRNARERHGFSHRFVEQKRTGRYTVWYPEDFDSTKKYHLIVLFHGNGHAPLLMLRWFRDLGLNDCIAVCPEAPYTKYPETMSKNRVHLSAAPADCGVPDSLRQTVMEESTKWYATVLEDARKQLPVYNELPIVIGFSQGGFFSLMLATRFPQLVRSLIVLSASYYEELQLPERASVLRLHGIDVLHCHGRKDPLVAFQVAEFLQSALKAQAVRTEFLPYEGVHWMNPEVNLKVKEWLRKRFEQKGQ